MISFLILPMQRVTRLPLLMDVRMFFYFSFLCSFNVTTPLWLIPG